MSEAFSESSRNRFSLARRASSARFRSRRSMPIPIRVVSARLMFAQELSTMLPSFAVTFHSRQPGSSDCMNAAAFAR
ncbi:MAG: hypothetical protein BWX50_01006 [Euryarchaeota archaeon ADurb.Bin009]|nr:MAG: hypothetical protein BWX50_01006 [Euryarchaeota archaeon ADurb.Bin009]